MKLLKLLIFAAIVYVAWVYGRPLLQERIVDTGEGIAAGVRDDADGCVQAAQRAFDAVGDHMEAFSDPERRDEAEGKAYEAIERAERSCTCPEPACEKGAAALVEMRGAVERLAGMARRDTAYFGNPAAEMENASQLLTEARAAVNRLD